MGKPNIITKEYMSNNEHFADVFNYYLYNGEERIQFQDLKELDATEVFVNWEKDADIQKENFRDVLKQLIVKQSKDARYVLLGIENQTRFDYTMPVRNMLTDAIRYNKQLSELWVKHKKEAEEKGEKYKLSKEEFISHFRKDDKLIPIIALVLYWGEGGWEAPRSLHEMLAVPDEKLLPYIADYKLNLIVPYEIKDFQKFHSDLREVMKIVSVSHDKEKMFELIKSDDAYKGLSKETAKMIKECTKLDVKITEEEDTVNMCTAVREFKEEAMNIGRVEGRMEGRRDAILELLEELGKIPERVIQIIKQESNGEKLKAWNKLASKVDTIEEFVEKM